MSEPSIIDHVTQTEDYNCVSACLAMVTGWPIDYITDQFHKSYFIDRNITLSDYLVEIGLEHNVCSLYQDFREGNVYFAFTPSINVKGGMHQLIIDVTNGEECYLFDPNEGKPGREVLVFGEVENGNEFEIKSLILEVEINRKYLLNWREKNPYDTSQSEDKFN